MDTQNRPKLKFGNFWCRCLRFRQAWVIAAWVFMTCCAIQTTHGCSTTTQPGCIRTLSADRIENGWVVLIDQAGAEYVVPKSFFPEVPTEGRIWVDGARSSHCEAVISGRIDRMLSKLKKKEPTNDVLTITGDDPDPTPGPGTCKTTVKSH